MAGRPRLAPGFTIAAGSASDVAAVWLVAGEDVRYRVGVAEPGWLVALLARCDGTHALDALLAGVPPTHQADARDLVTRLVAERVLVEGTAVAAHVTQPAAYRVNGSGALADALRAGAADQEGVELFVQDRLDHAALLARNREALAARRRWMWLSTGPGGRAYVGPLFVPDAGPCAECLLVHFKRLSPVPALYDVLLAHGERGGEIAAVALPEAAIATTAALARWKLGLVAAPVASPALYALHVVSVAELTVSAHAPLVDVECAACR